MKKEEDISERNEEKSANDEEMLSPTHKTLTGHDQIFNTSFVLLWLYVCMYTHIYHITFDFISCT